MRAGSLRVIAVGAGLLLAGAAGTAAGWPGTAAVVLHAAFLAPALLAPGLRRPGAAAFTGGWAVVVLGAAAWTPLPWPGVRDASVALHAVLGVAVIALPALASWASGGRGTPRPRRMAALAAGGLVLLSGGGWAITSRNPPPAPPDYDADACYRFLTATTADQAGEAAFPSALRSEADGKGGCGSNGCHAEYAGACAHTRSRENPAYRAVLADFVRRRGDAAGKWCRGCHEPAGAADPARAGSGAACRSCHGATRTHALFGSAALAIGADAPGLDPLLRPRFHARSMLAPVRGEQAALCAACHRKNWSLPQNGFRWMPGPDEYREWQAGPYSGASLLINGERRVERSCTGCHDPHPRGPARGAGQPITLDLFARRAAGRAAVLEDEVDEPAAGEELLLDVVVTNEGIGHHFPTGMPDLHEAWLEITVEDGRGAPAAGSGRAAPGAPLTSGAHVYRLRALDRAGQPVRHGDMDRAVSVTDWRRIPPGEADVARYRLRVPRGGLGRARARLLRRRNPEFSRWVGEAVQPVQVVAAVDRPLSGPAQARGDRPRPESARWRRYGMALTAVRDYPGAIAALERALRAAPADAESRLALGRLYLEEGDLLAARQQFARAREGAPLEARAWEGAVLRRMGQPGEAVTLLRPAARRYPRDGRLRFELGRAYMDQLANAAAAREFEAMLAVDPVDAAAHYNRMLCLQRLNRPADAAREETLFRLLAPEDAAAGPASAGRAGSDDRPLRVYRLGPAP